MSAYLFEQVSGAQFTVVTYRTTPDLVTGLLRGEIDLGFDYYAGLESTIAPDKLRVIATSGEMRDPLLKDVPTAKESGLPNYVVTSWNGIAARAGVAPEIVTLLSDEIRRALAAPDIQERMLRLGLDARGSTPEEMRDRIAKDIVKWREVIDKAGISSISRLARRGQGRNRNEPSEFFTAVFPGNERLDGKQDDRHPSARYCRR